LGEKGRSVDVLLKCEEGECIYVRKRRGEKEAIVRRDAGTWMVKSVEKLSLEDLDCITGQADR